MIQYKKVAFYTLGCKLNFSETSTISRLFEGKGFAKVEFNDAPDIFVINTCSVTKNADKECRMIVRKALRQNPAAFIAVIGCYAQLKPVEIAAIEGVDIVLGANEKFNLLTYISDLDKKERAEIHSVDIKNVKEFYPSFSAGDRTRSFLKVQDGCDYFCSFCTIPLARGTSRSNSVEETLKIAREAVRTGVKEIVLSGVNIGDFGHFQNIKHSVKAESFFDLIQELDDLNFSGRFRISSIEPDLLTDEIIEFVAASKKIAPHFHIPLQSGSGKILKLMRRKYGAELFADRIKKIKALLPHCCIGVDVIVGFPGETEVDFLETYSCLNNLDISYLHVFTYSERENTTAVKMSEIVPFPERNRRNKMLQILSEKKKRFFYEQNLGKEFSVLFESENNDGMIHGFTENYIKVKTEFDISLINKMKKIILQKIDGEGIVLWEKCLQKCSG